MPQGFIFSFSPLEISVTDFSAPIGASVFKVCVHLQAGKFSFFPSVTLICIHVIHMDIFSVKAFSVTTRVRTLKFGKCTKLDSDELYCVAKNQSRIAYQSLYILLIFLSLQ